MTDSYRILVVEDDPTQAMLIREFLRLAGMTEVDLAETIAILWQRLKQNTYDIILLDYRLPDGTGLDALLGITGNGYHIPVVMVTGQGDERVAVQAMQSGATDYLIKSGDYMLTLPVLIRKTVNSHRLQLSVERSLQQIRYQATLLNNVRDAIVVWDTEGRITYWNPAAVKLFGWSREERLDQKVADIYLPAFSPPVIVPREGDSAGQHVIRQCKTKNNQIIWVSSRVSVLRESENGNRIIGYMDVSHDITKRKEAEDALRAERNFVSAVLDTVGALVIVLDRNGRVVRFNRTCEQITGYTFVEVRGKFFWELFLLEEEREQAKALFGKIQEGEFPREHENFWMTRRGERRLITWSNTAIPDRQGEVEYVIATGIDISERRQAEKALRASEARYRAIVEDYQTEFISRFLPDGELTFVNQAYCQYLGRPREKLIGQNFLSMLAEADRVRVKRQLANLNKDDPVGTIECQVALPHQGLRWQQWTARAIFDADGKAFEFQSVGRDITERKEMEAQIQAAQTQLIQAARLATIGEMASGVAHQINNPLTTIIADAQLLLRQMAGEQPGRESAEAIEQAGWRLQEVVQRLLEFSRPAVATLESFSVNETIQRALLLVGAHIEAVGVKLTTDLADSLPLIRGNQHQLEDLWVNLLLLARDATTNGSVHNISIRSLAGSEGEVAIEVCDDGEPIPLDQLESVFEPNFIHSSCGRGTGMELSICREIVRQHHGKVFVDSTPGHVTIFRVTLPVEQA